MVILKTMFSLRLKNILALIGMSLLSLVIVGFTARAIMLSHFDQTVIDYASPGMLYEAAEYHRAYGSWEAAIKEEPFPSFAARIRFQTNSANAPPRPQLPIHPNPHSPASQGIPTDRAFGIDDNPPPFIITDMEGVTWVPTAQGKVGDVNSANRLKNALPIMDGDVQIGFAISTERSAISSLEEEYLSALKASWLLSFLLTVLIAIPIGFLLGDRLASPIRNLNQAFKAMQPGAIRQQVPVESTDELGELSESFNLMSAELSQAYEKLEELSLQDALTRLPNRRAFNHSADIILRQTKRHQRQSVLAIADIDHFKQINDSFSHIAGDKVLKLLAEILTANLREMDQIARYGGEEFVIMFPETDLNTAKKSVERLRNIIADYDWSPIDPDIVVTISIGLVEINGASTESLEEALTLADKKLYQAKNNGRNRTEA